MTIMRRMPCLTLAVGLACFALLVACGRSDYTDGPYPSPSGTYGVFASVNATDTSRADYAHVVLHLTDTTGQECATLLTRAGDANKWALGWMQSGDTIVLQSSDVGDMAFVPSPTAITEVAADTAVRMRAQELYRAKYQ